MGRHRHERGSAHPGPADENQVVGGGPNACTNVLQAPCLDECLAAFQLGVVADGHIIDKSCLVAARGWRGARDSGLGGRGCARFWSPSRKLRRDRSMGCFGQNGLDGGCGGCCGFGGGRRRGRLKVARSQETGCSQKRKARQGAGYLRVVHRSNGPILPHSSRKGQSIHVEGPHSKTRCPVSPGTSKHAAGTSPGLISSRSRYPGV